MTVVLIPYILKQYVIEIYFRFHELRVKQNLRYTICLNLIESDLFQNKIRTTIFIKFNLLL